MDIKLFFIQPPSPPSIAKFIRLGNDEEHPKVRKREKKSRCHLFLSYSNCVGQSL